MNLQDLKSRLVAFFTGHTAPTPPAPPPNRPQTKAEILAGVRELYPKMGTTFTLARPGTAPVEFDVWKERDDRTYVVTVRGSKRRTTRLGDVEQFLSHVQRTGHLPSKKR